MTPSNDSHFFRDGISPETSSFRSAITAALKLLENPASSGREIAESLRALDQTYQAAMVQEPTSAQVEVACTAGRLILEEPVLSKLVSQVARRSLGSEFFAAVINKMTEDAEPAPPEVLLACLPVHLKLVEYYRRTNDAQGMDKEIAFVEKALLARITEPTFIARELKQHDNYWEISQLAKVRYEQSMLCYSLGDFSGATDWGKVSERLCEEIGDNYGLLAARGNCSGLFVLAYARKLFLNNPCRQTILEASRDQLLDDFGWAKELLRGTKNPVEQGKLERVLFNNAAHLIHIADMTNNLELAEKMMREMEGNSVYRSAFDPQHPGDLTHAEEWAKPYSGILEKMRRAFAELEKERERA